MKATKKKKIIQRFHALISLGNQVKVANTLEGFLAITSKNANQIFFQINCSVRDKWTKTYMCSLK